MCRGPPPDAGNCGICPPAGFGRSAHPAAGPVWQRPCGAAGLLPAGLHPSCAALCLPLHAPRPAHAGKQGCGGAVWPRPPCAATTAAARPAPAPAPVLTAHSPVLPRALLPIPSLPCAAQAAAFAEVLCSSSAASAQQVVACQGVPFLRWGWGTSADGLAVIPVLAWRAARPGPRLAWSGPAYPLMLLPAWHAPRALCSLVALLPATACVPLVLRLQRHDR